MSIYSDPILMVGGGGGYKNLVKYNSTYYYIYTLLAKKKWFKGIFIKLNSASHEICQLPIANCQYII